MTKAKGRTAAPPKPKRASAAEDFEDRPREALVTLPVPSRSGARLVVRVRMVDQPDLVLATEGLPGVVLEASEARKRSAAERTREEVAAAHKAAPQMKAVARLGVVSPEFSFDGPVAGRPHWDSLHWQNRVAIVTAISALSGLEGVPDGLVTFPDDDELGVGNGGGVAGAGGHVGTAPNGGAGAAAGSAATERLDPAGGAGGAPGLRETSRARR